LSKIAILTRAGARLIERHVRTRDYDRRRLDACYSMRKADSRFNIDRLPIDLNGTFDMGLQP